MSTSIQPGSVSKVLGSLKGGAGVPTLEDAKVHEAHHQGGDVSAEYHELEGAAKEVIDASKEADAETDGPILIVVMGVSGSGKSTLGAALADALNLPFTDADALHPKSNIEKMSAGTPLNDEDRKPWLEIVRKSAVESCEKQVRDRDEEGRKRHGVVVGCSALKRKYRAVLRGEIQSEFGSTSDVGRIGAKLPTYFVYIDGSRDELMRRMEARKDHFMKASMLDSQFRDLENPEGEDGVVVVPLDVSTEEQVRVAKEGLRRMNALRVG